MLDKTIIPMEPVLHKKPFNNQSYLFQVKWDGIRILSFIQDNGLRLQSKRGLDKTRKFPELDILIENINAQKALLDGEVVVINEGKPSFPLVMKRELCKNPYTIKRYVKTLPINYIIFDILYLNGRDLTTQPLTQRMEILNGIVTAGGPVSLIENFTQGVQLFEAVKKRDWEGIVAKNKTSPYIIGKKSPHWKKIKNRRELDCVVGGLFLKNDKLSSLLLGVYSQDGLIYIGRGGSGLKSDQAHLLKAQVPQFKTDVSPFVNPPEFTRGEVVWTKPLLTVRVSYYEWTPDLKLRAPTIIGFTKKNPLVCKI